MLALFACQAPSAGTTSPSPAINPKPSPPSNPTPVPEAQPNPEQVGGSQLGDEGTATPPVPPCSGGMSGIGDLDKALKGQASTPGEWRDGLASEQAGVATLRYDLASGQTCRLEVNYVLTTQAANEQLWWTYRTVESADGKCTAPQEYVIEDVAVNLELTDVVDVDGSLVGLTNTPKQEQPSSTLSIRVLGVPAQANNTSRYLYSPTELDALCATHGDISGDPFEPPILSDGGWIPVIPNEAAAPPAPYVGASCIECLRHTCEYNVEQCEAATNCSVFTECAADCDEDPECSGACPDPYCDTGTEPGCYLLDCRNWICDEVCGQEPFGGTSNQVYETTDAGTDLDAAPASESASPEAAAPETSEAGPSETEWINLDPNVFTLTRNQTQDAEWSGTLESPRLTIEF